MNTRKHLKEGTYTYWVNKRSGTIRNVGVEYNKYFKNFKLTIVIVNLPYERMYFTKGSDMNGVDRFLKNYEFICENPTNDFFVNVLGAKKLKVILLGVEKPMVDLVSLKMSIFQN